MGEEFSEDELLDAVCGWLNSLALTTTITRISVVKSFSDYYYFTEVANAMAPGSVTLDLPSGRTVAQRENNMRQLLYALQAKPQVFKNLPDTDAKAIATGESDAIFSFLHYFFVLWMGNETEEVATRSRHASVISRRESETSEDATDADSEIDDSVLDLGGRGGAGFGGLHFGDVKQEGGKARPVGAGADADRTRAGRRGSADVGAARGSSHVSARAAVIQPRTPQTVERVESGSRVVSRAVPGGGEAAERAAAGDGKAGPAGGAGLQTSLSATSQTFQAHLSALEEKQKAAQATAAGSAAKPQLARANTLSDIQLMKDYHTINQETLAGTPPTGLGGSALTGAPGAGGVDPELLATVGGGAHLRRREEGRARNNTTASTGRYTRNQKRAGELDLARQLAETRTDLNQALELGRVMVLEQVKLNDEKEELISLSKTRDARAKEEALRSEKEIARLEDQLAERERLAELVEQELRTRIESLENSNHRLEQQRSKTLEIMNEAIQTNENQMIQMDQLQAEVAQAKSQVTSLQDENRRLRRENSELSTRTPRKRAESEAEEHLEGYRFDHEDDHDEIKASTLTHTLATPLRSKTSQGGGRGARGMVHSASSRLKIVCRVEKDDDDGGDAADAGSPVEVDNSLKSEGLLLMDRVGARVSRARRTGATDTAADVDSSSDSEDDLGLGWNRNNEASPLAHVKSPEAHNSLLNRERESLVAQLKDMQVLLDEARNSEKGVQKTSQASIKLLHEEIFALKAGKKEMEAKLAHLERDAVRLQDDADGMQHELRIYHSVIGPQIFELAQHTISVEPQSDRDNVFELNVTQVEQSLKALRQELETLRLQTRDGNEIQADVTQVFERGTHSDDDVSPGFQGYFSGSDSESIHDGASQGRVRRSRSRRQSRGESMNVLPDVLEEPGRAGGAEADTDTEGRPGRTRERKPSWEPTLAGVTLMDESSDEEGEEEPERRPPVLKPATLRAKSSTGADGPAVPADPQPDAARAAGSSGTRAGNILARLRQLEDQKSSIVTTEDSQTLPASGGQARSQPGLQKWDRLRAFVVTSTPTSGQRHSMASGLGGSKEALSPSDLGVGSSPKARPPLARGNTMMYLQQLENLRNREFGREKVHTHSTSRLGVVQAAGEPYDEAEDADGADKGAGDSAEEQSGARSSNEGVSDDDNRAAALPENLRRRGRERKHRHFLSIKGQLGAAQRVEAEPDSEDLFALTKSSSGKELSAGPEEAEGDARNTGPQREEGQEAQKDGPSDAASPERAPADENGAQPVPTVDRTVNMENARGTYALEPPSALLADLTTSQSDLNDSDLGLTRMPDSGALDRDKVRGASEEEGRGSVGDLDMDVGIDFDNTSSSASRAGSKNWEELDRFEDELQDDLLAMADQVEAAEQASMQDRMKVAAAQRDLEEARDELAHTNRLLFMSKTVAQKSYIRGKQVVLVANDLYEECVSKQIARNQWDTWIYKQLTAAVNNTMDKQKA